jgi:hypothetical protein
MMDSPLMAFIFSTSLSSVTPLTTIMRFFQAVSNRQTEELKMEHTDLEFKSCL